MAETAGRTAGGKAPVNFPADATEVVRRLTLEEKAALCVGKDYWTLRGVPRFGLPSLWLADGPHGLRKQPRSDNVSLAGNVPATCFPTAAALAATWDRELVRAVGRAIGVEARRHGVSVVLGPGVNIKRSPLCGRNFEYFSEDPLLAGELAAAFIDGLQSAGVGACVKHFAVNNQETRRFTIDAVVDERALREIYLFAFELAVKKAKPWLVMAAYNRVNGTYCTEHRRLLTDILRNEWGFDGVVVSDWGAVADRAAALAAGLDLEMPGTGPENVRDIVEAVRSGRLDEAAVDRAACRVVALLQKAAAAAGALAGLDGDYVNAHHALARRAAAEAAVLLKNDGPILPLAPGATIAVIGAMAKRPRYQGAGSSVITPTQLDNAYDALVARVGPARVVYAPGYDLAADVPGRERGPKPRLLSEARAAARQADVVVVFAGLPALYETEGLDRTSLSLPRSHDALIEAVAEVNPNVIVVLCNGAPVAMPWLDRVPAVLEAYLGGQAGGSAVWDVLFGDVNPCGKLAETFPLRLEDHPAHRFFPGGPRTVEYRESIYVGYRYYDTAEKEVLFPFGHGLSYTTFRYDNLRLSAAEIRVGEPLRVTVSVTNTGPRAGKEIVQLYVRDVAPRTFRPVHELKDFAKVALEPGEAKDVTFTLDRRAFAFWDTAAGGWRVEPGEFEIRIGASSRDIRLTATVRVVAESETVELEREPDQREAGHQREAGQAPGGGEDRSATAAPPEYLHPKDCATFSAGAFAAVYGRPLPPNEPGRRGGYTLHTPLGDMRESWAARLFLWVASRAARFVLKDDPDSPMRRRMGEVLAQMPVRSLVMGGAAGLNRTMQEGLVDIFNGHTLRGLRKLVSGALRRR